MKMPLHKCSTASCAALASLIGLGVWIVGSILSGQEGWDHASFFLAGVPVMLVTSGLVGYLRPGHSILYGFAVVLPQPIYLLATTPLDRATLLPLGLVLFFAIGIGCILSARFGSFLRELGPIRKREKEVMNGGAP